MTRDELNEAIGVFAPDVARAIADAIEGSLNPDDTYSEGVAAHLAMAMYQFMDDRELAHQILDWAYDIAENRNREGELH